MNSAVVLTNDMLHAISTEVVPDVAIMLSDVLLANLTNILTDSVSYALTKSLGELSDSTVGSSVRSNHAIATDFR